MTSLLLVKAQNVLFLHPPTSVGDILRGTFRLFICNWTFVQILFLIKLNKYQTKKSFCAVEEKKTFLVAMNPVNESQMQRRCTRQHKTDNPTFIVVYFFYRLKPSLSVSFVVSQRGNVAGTIASSLRPRCYLCSGPQKMCVCGEKKVKCAVPERRSRVVATDCSSSHVTFTPTQSVAQPKQHVLRSRWNKSINKPESEMNSCLPEELFFQLLLFHYCLSLFNHMRQWRRFKC